MLGAVADSRGTQIAMAIPLMGFAVAWTFPLYLNLYCRRELDGFRESKVGVIRDSENQLEKKDIEVEEVEDIPDNKNSILRQ